MTFLRHMKNFQTVLQRRNALTARCGSSLRATAQRVELPLQLRLRHLQLQLGHQSARPLVGGAALMNQRQLRVLLLSRLQPFSPPLTAKPLEYFGDAGMSQPLRHQSRPLYLRLLHRIQLILLPSRAQPPQAPIAKHLGFYGDVGMSQPLQHRRPPHLLYRRLSLRLPLRHRRLPVQYRQRRTAEFPGSYGGVGIDLIKSLDTRAYIVFASLLQGC